MENNYLIGKEDMRSLVNACERITSLLYSLDADSGLSFKQLEKLISTTTTCECFFTYLYVEVWHYGKVTDIIDTRNKVFAKYTMSACLVFSEPQAFKLFILKLHRSYPTFSKTINNISLTDDANVEKTLTDDVDAIGKALNNIYTAFIK